MEQKIIDIAREVFIERGYTETSMSEIAARVGINRPALHYYFRTKDKMFQAVFGSIVSSILPKVFDTLLRKSTPIAERIEAIIDAYYELFNNNPKLPMFILRELHRDPKLLIHTALELNIMDTGQKVFTSLQEEIDEGKLKNVSPQFILFNFYSLLTFPFLTKDVLTIVFDIDDENFKTTLNEWKQNIISQLRHLLEV